MQNPEPNKEIAKSEDKSSTLGLLVTTIAARLVHDLPRTSTTGGGRVL
jgi:hypothetical protein